MAGVDLAMSIEAEGLRDDQWERVKGLVPGGTKGKRGPRTDNRRFLDALLWMARSGGRWKDLPERLGDDRTVKRRYYDRIARGVLDQMLADLAREADLEWLMIDSTIVRAHQHAAGARKVKGGRMPRAWAEASGKRVTTATGSPGRGASARATGARPQPAIMAQVRSSAPDGRRAHAGFRVVRPVIPVPVQTDPDSPLPRRARRTPAPRRCAQACFRSSAMNGIVTWVYWVNCAMGDGRPMR